MSMLYLSLKRASAILILLICILLISCKDEVIDTANPANLVVEIINLDDGSGSVAVNATANNTTSYEFYPGEVLMEEPIINTTGNFNYTYSSTSLYLTETRAYGSSGKFIANENQISVQIAGETCEPSNPIDGYKTPLCYAGMNLVWQDEFTGNVLNATNWTHEIGNGNGGWGNNELQYYRAENTFLANGYLTIEARKEDFDGRNYTSSRFITKNKQTVKYGRIDIRAKLPQGQGLWPALWMLGSNIDQVGWPACGEIDIMELIGGAAAGRDNTSHGTIHWSDNGQASTGDSYSLSSGIFNDKFHVFTIIWTASDITWFIDDVQYFNTDITPGTLSEFNQASFFIFNVAVGGNWPGNPDGTTVFPQQMIVDYVRVFQNN
jgi:beta-glucanase (GH16 family)